MCLCMLSRNFCVLMHFRNASCEMGTQWGCLCVQRTVWLCDSCSATMIGHSLKITSSVVFFSSHVATFSCQNVNCSHSSDFPTPLPVLTLNWRKWRWKMSHVRIIIMYLFSDCTYCNTWSFLTKKFECTLLTTWTGEVHVLCRYTFSFLGGSLMAGYSLFLIKGTCYM
jgi:hypothetical protein